MLPTPRRSSDRLPSSDAFTARHRAQARRVTPQPCEPVRGAGIQSMESASGDMITTWHRVTRLALIGASVFSTIGALAQEGDQDGAAFIPASDEPCGVSCPDPDAPLSPVNYPPRDDNFETMFASTESGMRIVPNPHWNGKEATGEWCGVYCRDPYAPANITNQLRRNDAQEIMLVFYRDGEDVVLRSKANPYWAGRNDTIEALGFNALSAPLPLLGLAALSGELDLGTEGPGSKVVRGSINRTGIAYHAYGNDVFRPHVLQTIGGVLSQASIAERRDGPPPKAELALRLDGTYPGYLLVGTGDVTGRYRIRYDDLVPMALFVDSGGTSLYTLWEDKLPTTFQLEAGFAKYDGGPGLLALEFADTRFADALYFLDLCRGCVTGPENDSEATATARSTFATGVGSERPSSYINADVGSMFEVDETRAGAVAVSGSIIRFHWSGDADTGVSIDRQSPIVRPDELRTSVGRWLAEHEDEYMLQLMFGIDLRKEASILARRRLADAFFLFETLALLRATKLKSPEDWSAFMTLLSSEWLVRQNREPWERYTRTFCSIYPTAFECSE